MKKIAVYTSIVLLLFSLYITLPANSGTDSSTFSIRTFIVDHIGVTVSTMNFGFLYPGEVVDITTTTEAVITGEAGQRVSINFEGTNHSETIILQNENDPEYEITVDLVIEHPRNNIDLDEDGRHIKVIEGTIDQIIPQETGTYVGQATVSVQYDD